MPMHEGKTDRQARLVKLEHLLCQNRKSGLTITEMAKITKMSERTIRRDLAALQRELLMPIWDDRNSGEVRWYVEEGYVLPPIDFTLPEAMTLFMSVRLMLSHTYRYNPDAASLFLKLNSIIKPPLNTQIQNTLKWMADLPSNEKLTNILTLLAHAWTSQKQAKIEYVSFNAKTTKTHVLETYFIQPVVRGHATYVIGFCRDCDSILLFKVERIQSIKLLDVSYKIPSDFNANQYLCNAWDIVAFEDSCNVKLCFTPEIAKIIEETTWHPSQKIRKQKDGSLIATYHVSISDEFVGWVMSWGEKVEVFKPLSLRKQIKSIADKMAQVYG